MSEHLPPEALDDWAEALAERFGLDRDDIPVTLILDLAKVTSTTVVRPAAPVSAFVAGLVAGRAGGGAAEAAQAAGEIADLANEVSERRSW